jgi:lysophospholipase
MAAPLFFTAENPTPARAEANYLIARDGRRIRYALFGAAAQPFKGTVVVLQGRNECIEKYFETIRDLAARGFASATLDWRGQGGSERLLSDPWRGYVDSFDDYVRDLEQFFEEIVLPDCRGPFYILGHSTGALVALLAAPRMVNRVQRMMLSAPLLELKSAGYSMRTIRRASALLYTLGLGSLYLSGRQRRREPTPFAINVLTTDHNRYRRNQAIYETYPELAVGGATAAWLYAACVAAETVSDLDFMDRIQVPTLFVAAGSDEVVSTPAIEAFASRLRATSILTIDGARHELLQEADRYREQFLAAFDAFIPGEAAVAGR